MRSIDANSYLLRLCNLVPTFKLPNRTTSPRETNPTWYMGLGHAKSVGQQCSPNSEDIGNEHGGRAPYGGFWGYHLR
jgi:hypothetical protein